MMEASLSGSALARQNRRYRGTGGRSQENREAGFRPAFFDTETCAMYPSCFADGHLAPLHLLDGLPKQLVIARDDRGRVAEVRAAVIAGFARAGRFYTRDEAARCMAGRQS